MPGMEPAPPQKIPLEECRMQKEFLWKLFSKTGAPEVYLAYHRAAGENR